MEFDRKNAQTTSADNQGALLIITHHADQHFFPYGVTYSVIFSVLVVRSAICALETAQAGESKMCAKLRKSICRRVGSIDPRAVSTSPYTPQTTRRYSYNFKIRGVWKINV